MKLFHTHEKNIKNKNGIWLSAEPDDNYGSKITEFYLDEKTFKFASYNVVINYIFKYDIKNFSDAEEIEWGSETLAIEELYDLMDENDISEDEAYNILYNKSFDTENYFYQFPLEIMMHPHYFKFFEKLKNDGYDGYFFPYEYDPRNIYYFCFYPEKIKIINNENKMKIKLTESKLKQIVSETIKKIIKEKFDNVPEILNMDPSLLSTDELKYCCKFLSANADEYLFSNQSQKRFDDFYEELQKRSKTNESI